MLSKNNGNILIQIRIVQRLKPKISMYSLVKLCNSIDEMADAHESSQDSALAVYVKSRRNWRIIVGKHVSEVDTTILDS